jgi:hypothetical protein
VISGRDAERSVSAAGKDLGRSEGRKDFVRSGLKVIRRDSAGEEAMNTAHCIKSTDDVLRLPTWYQKAPELGISRNDSTSLVKPRRLP